MTGGPPVRGDLLPLWGVPERLSEDEHKAWELAAYRIALGVELVGHLEPIVDPERLFVGFCAHSAELAVLLRDAVLQENVGADVARAHPGMAQAEPCDVILPCRPNASEEEVNHAVLAAVKAAHTFFCSAPIA